MAEQLETVENIRKQYIVVKIGNEQYGIDISYVDNIVRMQKITRVPRVQNFFKGIINLRGEIVPVMSPQNPYGTGRRCIYQCQPYYNFKKLNSRVHWE